MTGGAPCTVVAPDGTPAELLSAFWRYDRALLANDLPAISELFAPGPDTLRGDGRQLLVGYDAITRFRAARARIPTRAVDRLHVQLISDGAALLVACTRDGEARGMQTQLWQRKGTTWLITAAHVTNAVPSGTQQASEPDGHVAAMTAQTGCAAFDGRIWRVVGDPLVRRTAPGPLLGHTLAVKDLFALQGQRIGAGNPSYLDEREPEPSTAPAVSTLLAHGADVVGIARSDEFAYSIAGTNVHYGTPPNPAAPGHLSGGSSSGCAAAVALGHVTVGLGTDTAGSVRVPASYQGLYGLRTTHGAIATIGLIPLAPAFDTVGWITRDLATARAVADCFFGPPAGRLVPERAVVVPEVTAHADPGVRVAFDDCLARLAWCGAIPEPEAVHLPVEEFERWFRAFRTVQGFQAWHEHGAWLTIHPGAVADDIAERFAEASAITEAAASEAAGIIAQARERLSGMLADAVLLLPATSGTAPAHDAGPGEVAAVRAATLRLTCLAGLTGSPAVTLPLMRVGGFPVGLSVVSAPGSDAGLLQFAERLTGPP
jgi:Asp-tRNA(Asn)/Glu-tRNA(Gln) amidotransferase A subunit family amidase